MTGATLAEALLDSATDAFRPGNGRELAAVLDALPGIFTGLAAGLGGLAAWARELRVGGSPGEMTAETAAQASAAAETAAECAAAFRARNAFWLDGQDCAFPPLDALTEDIAAGLTPDDSTPAGYALADTLDTFTEAAELIADELSALAARAEALDGNQETGDGLGELARHAWAVTTAADNASAAYHQANTFWLAARSTV